MLVAHHKKAMAYLICFIFSWKAVGCCYGHKNVCFSCIDIELEIMSEWIKINEWNQICYNIFSLVLRDPTINFV